MLRAEAHHTEGVAVLNRHFSIAVRAIVKARHGIGVIPLNYKKDTISALICNEHRCSGTRRSTSNSATVVPEMVPIITTVPEGVTSESVVPEVVPAATRHRY